MARPGSLARLSVRLALEFNADSIPRDVTRKQVTFGCASL
jgi:hypothetical protein